MIDIIPADGAVPNRFLVVGERPGYDEKRAYDDGDERMNFVGPAGQELWDRLHRIADIDRLDCRVCNLVPTFSPQGKAPTPKEIAEHGWRLTREIRRTRPELIITVGYHAARYLLPQFARIDGDYFHGLAFSVRHGRLEPIEIPIVPVVHSSAALHQPNRYQHQLSADVGRVATVVASLPEVSLHQTRRLAPYPSGLAPFFGTPRVVGIDTEYGHNQVEAVTLALDETYTAIVEPDAEPKAIRHLKTICEHARLVAHAAPSEYHSLLKLGIERWDDPIDDTMIMAYVLCAPHRGLKTILYRDLHIEHPSYDDIVTPIDNTKVQTQLTEWRTWLAPKTVAPKKQKGQPKPLLPAVVKSARRTVRSIVNILDKPSEDRTLRQRWHDSVWGEKFELPPEATWKDVPKDIREPYAIGDAVGTVLAREYYWPQIKAQGLRRVYEIDRNVLPFLVRNEHVGLAVDSDRLDDLSRQFRSDFARNQARIDYLAGHPVNPLSGEQVSDCLFHELGVTPTRLTKTEKHHTTADKYLKARRSEHEIINLILDSRQLNKYRGTYTEKLPGMLRDGRYHPDWLYATTVTGRLAEQILVLIPKHDLLAKIMRRDNRATAIRDCFHSTPGHRLVSVDLSQIELRVMAHLSQDDRLLKVFRTNGDMHSLVAADLLGAPRDRTKQDDSLHRLPAKTFNFGIINGMTEYGMLDQLHEAGQLQWTLDEVRDFRKQWFRTYRGVDHFWKAQIAHGKRTGYVVSMFGRRRYLHGLRSTSEQVRLEAERQSLFAIQSSADDISKLWNIRIWKHIIRPAHQSSWYCEPWVRVHDDTTLEVDRKHIVDVSERMLRAVPDLLDVPTTAEAKASTRWGSLEKIAA